MKRWWAVSLLSLTWQKREWLRSGLSPDFFWTFYCPMRTRGWALPWGQSGSLEFALPTCQLPGQPSQTFKALNRLRFAPLGSSLWCWPGLLKLQEGEVQSISIKILISLKFSFLMGLTRAPSLAFIRSFQTWPFVLCLYVGFIVFFFFQVC